MSQAALPPLLLPEQGPQWHHPLNHMAADIARWVLLVYTVPSAPSRLRAAVWRDLKRAGALYLRDGVCALPDLPERSEARASLEEVASRVDAVGGRATLVMGGHLPPERARSLAAELRGARDEEYADLAREAERLLAAVRRERSHRELGGRGAASLEADVAKLRKWSAQIAARDYLDSPGREAALAAVERCEAAVPSRRVPDGAQRSTGSRRRPAGSVP